MKEYEFCLHIACNKSDKGTQPSELSNLNELLVCCSMDKNRRHVFFIRAESS